MSESKILSPLHTASGMRTEGCFLLSNNDIDRINALELMQTSESRQARLDRLVPLVVVDLGHEGGVAQVEGRGQVQVRELAPVAHLHH